MCGIAAIFAYTPEAPPVNADTLLRLREAMISRGPEGAGLWLSDHHRFGLAHRRLALLDLSAAGPNPWPRLMAPYGALSDEATSEFSRLLEYKAERKGMNELSKPIEISHIPERKCATVGPPKVKLRRPSAWAIPSQREKAGSCFGRTSPCHWRGKFCAVKQVAPLIAEEADRIVVVTVFVYYF